MNFTQGLQTPINISVFQENTQSILDNYHNKQAKINQLFSEVVNELNIDYANMDIGEIQEAKITQVAKKINYFFLTPEDQELFMQTCENKYNIQSDLLKQHIIFSKQEITNIHFQENDEEYIAEYLKQANYLFLSQDEQQDVFNNLQNIFNLRSGAGKDILKDKIYNTSLSQRSEMIDKVAVQYPEYFDSSPEEQKQMRNKMLKTKELRMLKVSKIQLKTYLESHTIYLMYKMDPTLEEQLFEYHLRRFNLNANQPLTTE